MLVGFKEVLNVSSKKKELPSTLVRESPLKACYRFRYTKVVSNT
jgi:hypothetical protein